MAINISHTLDQARVQAYIRKFGYHEHEVLKKCRLETLKNRKDATMMTAPEEAAFLAFMVKSIGAKKGLEIGCFTGYSSIALALALPSNGRLTVCEMDADLLSVASGYWKEAKVDHLVTAMQGDAKSSLSTVLARGEENTFDFAYIDANKESYMDYYEMALRLVRVDGLIIIDNTLWGGRVADTKATDGITIAMRTLNEFILKDSRVDSVLTPMGDGVTFARKLASG
jgi:predicted O-methyltransferase YrrM